MANRDKSRFKSTTGLNDLLFNLLVGFVFLFIVAFLLINPPTKKEDAPKKAEYLIIIEWDEGVNKAVDKFYGSKFDEAKTNACHDFVNSTVPNGEERVKKVAQTLY